MERKGKLIGMIMSDDFASQPEPNLEATQNSAL